MNTATADTTSDAMLRANLTANREEALAVRDSAARCLARMVVEGTSATQNGKDLARRFQIADEVVAGW